MQGSKIGTRRGARKDADACHVRPLWSETLVCPNILSIGSYGIHNMDMLLNYLPKNTKESKRVSDVAQEEMWMHAMLDHSGQRLSFVKIL